jgi:acyl-coenzyme A synthetase/AMP-(fatty) acid ligase
MCSLSFDSLFSEKSDRVICSTANNEVRLSELHGKVTQLAAELSASPHQNWILASESTVNFLSGFLALLAAGKEVVLPPNNLNGTINETITGADGLLTDLDIDTHLARINIVTTSIERIESREVITFDVNKLFVQICTSGSTGEPRQIRKSLATLEDEINSLEQLWGELIANKVFISTVSHQHIYGLLFRVLWPLFSKRIFVNENIEYPEQIEAISKRLGELVLVSSPAYLKRMADVLDEEIVRQSVQVIYSSGGPLSRDTSLYYAQHFNVTPIEVLGSTETGGIAYRQQQQQHDMLWQKFPAVEIRREEDSGALAIRSPFCCTQDWYQMGDAVELIDDQHFKLLGRLDRIVKLEEKRISLDRMETVLGRNNLVDQVKIVVLEGYRTILGAVCILNHKGQVKLHQLGRRELSNQLKEYLAAYFDRVTLPRKWRYVADFPYNTQGKITQAALAELFEDNQEDGEDNGSD